MPPKPKTVQPATPDEEQKRDQFITPNYATDLIVPFIPDSIRVVWECCADDTEKMAGRLWNKWAYNPLHDELQHSGLATGLRDIVATGICKGLQYNVLAYTPGRWDCAITNPPYSLKKQIVQRFIALDKPFAFLIPSDFSQWVIDAIKTYDCKMVVPTRRINYITPNGKQGKESSAQFHSLWLTRKMNVPDRFTVVDLSLEDLKNI